LVAMENDSRKKSLDYIVVFFLGIIIFLIIFYYEIFIPYNLGQFDIFNFWLFIFFFLSYVLIFLAIRLKNGVSRREALRIEHGIKYIYHENGELNTELRYENGYLNP